MSLYSIQESNNTTALVTVLPQQEPQAQIKEALQVSVSSVSEIETTKKRFKFGSKRKEQDIEKSDVEQELLKPTSSITNVAETLPESVSMVSETQTKKRRFRFGKRKKKVHVLSMEEIKLCALSKLNETEKPFIIFQDLPVLGLQYGSRERDIDVLAGSLNSVAIATLFYGLIIRTQDMYSRLDILSTKNNNFSVRMRIISFVLFATNMVLAAISLGWLFN